MSTTTAEQQQATAALSLLKIVAGCLLSLSAFIGSLVPELLVRSCGAKRFAEVVLPVGNALSAGLLFGAGMMHFFAEGTSALATASLLALSTAAGKHHQMHHSEGVAASPPPGAGGGSPAGMSTAQHKSSHENLIHVATHDGFATAAPAMMLGYLLSLVIDRVVLEKLKRSRKLPDWVSQHSHSHGGAAGAHDHSSDNPDEDCAQHASAAELAATTPIAAASASNVAAAIAVPAARHGHAAAASAAAHHHQPLASAASVLTIAVLMSLHSAIEGTTLALETSAKTLRGAFVPLFIHRFFDGVVVGFQASAATSGDSSGEAAGASLCSELKRIVFRKTTLVLLGWSIITPVVLVLVLTTSSPSSASSLTQSWAGAWAQCFAAGSFVYICGELLNDVFARHLQQQQAATDVVTRTLGPLGSRVAGLAAGVSIVLFLESMDSD